MSVLSNSAGVVAPFRAAISLDRRDRRWSTFVACGPFQFHDQPAPRRRAVYDRHGREISSAAVDRRGRSISPCRREMMPAPIDVGHATGPASSLEGNPTQQARAVPAPAGCAPYLGDDAEQGLGSGHSGRAGHSLRNRGACRRAATTSPSISTTSDATRCWPSAVFQAVQPRLNSPATCAADRAGNLRGGVSWRSKSPLPRRLGDAEIGHAGCATTYAVGVVDVE